MCVCARGRACFRLCASCKSERAWQYRAYPFNLFLKRPISVILVIAIALPCNVSLPIADTCVNTCNRKCIFVEVSERQLRALSCDISDWVASLYVTLLQCLGSVLEQSHFLSRRKIGADWLSDQGSLTSCLAPSKNCSIAPQQCYAWPLGLLLLNKNPQTKLLTP